MNGETVNFTINTTAGGITLVASSGVSDQNGEVVASLRSGTVATSVRVTAVVASNTAVATQSSAVAIATGPADQNSISLSVSTHNPNAWAYDGVQVTITARLADRFNNPIQDGTSISFTTELGSIQPFCSTVNGSCTVNWTSQDPRGISGPGSNAGRSTILATVEGEESFSDVNGNGIFDDGDSFTDIAEAYIDENESGTYDLGEIFIDYNNNGLRDAADGFYNGSGCGH
ncbi:MAG: hypothetical protein OEZ38_05910, partial [Gammaproteobacteria bacterium]|nr:hypothetical protein [Gammaproteobacteria bacterium]